MHRTNLFAVLAALSALCANIDLVQASFTFQGLGDLAGGETWSIASGVSADGSVVVGSSNSTNGREAMRWTSGGGMAGLGDLSGGTYSSRGAAISGDGNVITGWSISATGREVIRWTQAGGMVGLGDLPGGTNEGFGQGINYDGSVIVGQAESAAGTEAFRWTSGGGMVGLGDLSGGSFSSSAYGVSADGSVVAGTGHTAAGAEAFRWNSAAGLAYMGYFHDGFTQSELKAVSADGLTFVGQLIRPTNSQAIFFSNAGPSIGLGDLPGGSIDSIALAVSPDFSVVGRGNTALGDEAFLWTPTLGMLNLRDYLTANGVSGLANWTLTAATGISADGRTIVGQGINPLGFEEAWIATVPEPSTLLLAGCGAFAVLLAAGGRKSRRTRIVAGLVVCLACWFASSPALAVTINTVPVGNVGNASDTSGFGALGYDYRIGTYEVTNTQYAEFLNAKAASDPLGLYNTSMGGDARGGITRSGSSGSYTYAVKTNMGDKPINYVSWYDAVRFANWLHNGQGPGDTETGAYTLLGGTPIPSNAPVITRSPGAVWFLPSRDEWYKAAFYDPTLAGGVGDYWDYATRSNSAPTVATANSVGDISNPGANVANYLSGADWNSVDGNVTTVGSAGPSSTSYFGTSDQGGNIWEWNETLLFNPVRDGRGGGYNSVAGQLLANHAQSLNAGTEHVTFGFRVATVPEPSTLVLAGCGGLALLFLGRVRSSRRARLKAVHLFAGAAWLLSGSAAGAVTIPVTDSFDGGFQQPWVFVDEDGNAPPDATTISTAADDLRMLSAPPPFNVAVFGVLGYGNAAFEFSDAVVRAAVFTLEDTPLIAGGTGRSDNDVGVVLRFDPIQGAGYTLIVDFVAATLTLSHIDAGQSIGEDLAIESIPDFDPATRYTLELSAIGPVLTGRVFDGTTLLASVGAVNGALTSGYAAVGAAINNNAPTTYLGTGFDDFSVVPEPSTLVLAACGALGLLLAAGRRKRTASALLLARFLVLAAHGPANAVTLRVRRSHRGFARLVHGSRFASRFAAILLLFALSRPLPLEAGTAYYDPIYGVGVSSNVVYGTGLINGGASSLDLLMDVYYPTDIGQALPAQSPAIVFIHGGSWQSGSKTVGYVQDFANSYAALGYVVGAINYRLLGHNVPETHGPGDMMILSVDPEVVVPQELHWTVNAGIEDAGKAIAYLRSNPTTANYDLDTDRIGIGGVSAGAINALAHTYDNPPADEAPRVVLSYIGALIGAESLLDAADDTPAFVVNGDVDPLIPVIAPNTMISQMNALGIYNEYYLQEGVGHDVDFDLVFGGDTLVNHNIDFLAQYLAPEPSTLALVLCGAVGWFVVIRRRRRVRVSR